MNDNDNNNSEQVGGYFYVASTLNNYRQTSLLIGVLEEHTPYKCTFNWPNTYIRHKAMEKPPSPKVLKSTAQEEINAVACADFIVLFLPGRIGAHVELGVAIAKKKPVYLVGNNQYMNDDRGPDIFLFLDNVINFTSNSGDASFMNDNKLARNEAFWSMTQLLVAGILNNIHGEVRNALTK